MGFKLGRKANKAQGTPALSEASYDDKHSVDEKHPGKEKPASPAPEGDQKQVIPPVSFKSLFRYALATSAKFPETHPPPSSSQLCHPVRGDHQLDRCGGRISSRSSPRMHLPFDMVTPDGLIHFFL